MADREGFKERLLTFLDYKNIKNAQFEQLIGASNGYVNNIRHGMGREKLEQALKEFPDLNRDWLLYGEGKMLNDTAGENINHVNEAAHIYNSKRDEVTMSREVFETLANLAKCVESQQKTIEKLVGNMDEEDTAGSA